MGDLTLLSLSFPDYEMGIPAPGAMPNCAVSPPLPLLNLLRLPAPPSS